MLRSPQLLPPAADVSLLLMSPPPHPASTKAAEAATQARPNMRCRRFPRAMRCPFICSAPVGRSRCLLGPPVARGGVPRDPVEHHSERGDRDAGCQPLAEQLRLREARDNEVAQAAAA